MGLKRRKFTRDFKIEVVREVEAGKSIAQAAREYQIHPILIGRWRKEHLQYAEQAFAGNGNGYRGEERIAELERMVGKLMMENELLKKALLRVEGQVRKKPDSGGI